jgi:hypothetical protein
MNFGSDLAYSEIAGDLLVHFSGRYQQHHLQFAGRERSKPLLHLRTIALDYPPLPATLGPPASYDKLINDTET